MGLTSSRPTTVHQGDNSVNHVSYASLASKSGADLR